jgi:hypothetical protein
VDDLHVLILRGVGHHGVDEDLGLAAGVAGHDAVAGFDMPNRLFSGDQAFLIDLFPIHK